jgi:hypothetical protein
MASRAVVHVMGPDAEPVSAVVERLKSEGIVILDEQPNMLLVEGSRDLVARALGAAAGWNVGEVASVPRPETRPKVLRKP